MTGVALPPAVVAILRHPEPAEGAFTPTKFNPLATRVWFAKQVPIVRRHSP